MRAHVVDANVINKFQRERLANRADCATAAIDAITFQHFISIDDNGHCTQEWLDCAAGAYPLALQDWITDMLIAQKLRLATLCTDSMHRELSQIGMPKKDHKWVRLAVGAGSFVIVSDDIDFFDPAMKKAASSTVTKLKEASGGPVAKYLLKNRKISVLCPSSVPRHIAEYDASA